MLKKRATFFIFAAKSQDKIFFYSEKFHTARSQFFSTQKYEYLGESENILTQRSVPQATSNDEKN